MVFPEGMKLMQELASVVVNGEVLKRVVAMGRKWCGWIASTEILKEAWSRHIQVVSDCVCPVESPLPEICLF